MQVTAEKQQLIESYRLLFEPEAEVSHYSLPAVDPARLREAYHASVMASHPDRAEILGVPEERLTELTQEINAAYEALRPYISGDGSSGAEPPGDHYYGGRLPQKKLRFATFLYYKKVVSWRMLIDALAWQRQTRPLIGQIAVAYQMLDPDDITAIIRLAESEERFGEAAVRMNMLQPFDIRVVLGKQASYDCKIGRYFLEREAVSSEDLSQLLSEFRRHNFKMEIGR